MMSRTAIAAATVNNVRMSKNLDSKY